MNHSHTSSFAAARVVTVLCGIAAVAGFVSGSSHGQDSALVALVSDTEDYLDVLHDGVSGDSAVVLRHIAQLWLILPDDIKHRVAEGDLALPPRAAQIRSDAGQTLVDWWRRQDPLPASPVNERLLEHVQRVQFAETHYVSDGHVTGLDARGEVYVRYGRPEREVVVRFDEPEFTDKLFQVGMVVDRSDFPENMFWRYGHIDGAGHYLFVKSDGEYRIAGTTELLPRRLRTGFTQGKRGQRRTEIALAAMRTIYRQLAAEAPVFLDRYSEVDNYISDSEMPGRVAARTLGEAFQRSVLDQDDDTQMQPGGEERPASEFVQRVITSSSLRDDQMAYQRDLLMPKTFTEVHRALPLLPVGVRTARFLERDGTTRTELYWGPVPGALRRTDLDEDYLLYVTTVHMDARYRRRAVNTRLIQVTDLPKGSDAVIPAQRDVLLGDTAMYNIAVQWDLYRLVRNQGGWAVPGQRLRVAADYMDSLSALDGSGKALEMSDLKPVMIWSAVELTGESEPYPYLQIDTDVPLGVYFEIYNLRYGRDDYTRYSVTYQISRRTEDGRMRQAPASVSTSYTGTRSREQQEVLLDLTDWKDAGLVDVRVTVHDLTAGRSATRSIAFELL